MYVARRTQLPRRSRTASPVEALFLRRTGVLYAAVQSVHFSCALDCLCLFVAGARVEQLLSIERADFLLLSQWTRCSFRRVCSVLGLVDLESVAPAARKWIHKCGLLWSPCCGDSRSINVALGPWNFVPPSHPRTGCSAGVLGHGCLARGVLNYRTRCSSLQLRVGIRQGPFPHELSLSMSESESGSTLLAGLPNPFTDFCERLDTLLAWFGKEYNACPCSRWFRNCGSDFLSIASLNHTGRASCGVHEV